MIKTVPIEVKCRRDPPAIRTCHVLTEAGKGSRRLGMSNGCEELDANAACTECVLALSELYNSDSVIPDVPIYLP